jgi:hypothetical protein
LINGAKIAKTLELPHVVSINETQGKPWATNVESNVKSPSKVNEV